MLLKKALTVGNKLRFSCSRNILKICTSKNKAIANRLSKFLWRHSFCFHSVRINEFKIKGLLNVFEKDTSCWRSKLKLYTSKNKAMTNRLSIFLLRLTCCFHIVRINEFIIKGFWMFLKRYFLMALQVETLHK